MKKWDLPRGLKVGTSRWVHSGTLLRLPRTCWAYKGSPFPLFRRWQTLAHCLKTMWRPQSRQVFHKIVHVPLKIWPICTSSWRPIIESKLSTTLLKEERDYSPEELWDMVTYYAQENPGEHPGSAPWTCFWRIQPNTEINIHMDDSRSSVGIMIKSILGGLLIISQ